MIHINSMAKEGFLLSFLNFIMPEYYSATTINDFLNDKSDIKPTKKVLPWGVFFYNCALVQFPAARYRNKDEKTGILLDVNSSIDVSLDYILSINEEERLEDDVVLYDPIIIYKPKNDGSWLYDYKEQGPIEIGYNAGYEWGLNNLGLSPA